MQVTSSAPTALIVEDHPVNLIVSQKFMEKLGFVCTSAENGQIALDLLAKQRFDVILMDCQMPVLDGYQATAAIRAHADSTISKIPIIGVTANADEPNKARCLALGMNDFLGKPLLYPSLEAAVKRFVKL